MKVILTGSTGLIGSGVLKRCIEHPGITSIVALTRRPIEDVKSDKLNNVIHKDFHNYDSKVIDQLKGAQACIWYYLTSLDAPFYGLLTVKTGC